MGRYYIYKVMCIQHNYIEPKFDVKPKGQVPSNQDTQSSSPPRCLAEAELPISSSRRLTDLEYRSGGTMRAWCCKYRLKSNIFSGEFIFQFPAVISKSLTIKIPDSILRINRTINSRKQTQWGGSYAYGINRWK